MSDAPILPGVKINLKVPEDVTRETVTFARRILGPLAEIGDLFSDKVRFLRFKSAAKTLNRAAKIVKENGIAPKTIPMKFLIPFIEDCSLEEEDSPLIEQWAALLAAASKGFNPLHVAIRDVLKNISSKEAQIIVDLAKKMEPMDNRYDPSHPATKNVEFNTKCLIQSGLRLFQVGEIKDFMLKDYVDRKLTEVTRRSPIIPLYYSIPWQGGLEGGLWETSTYSSDFFLADGGSLYLLERLEILKSHEAHFRVSDDRSIPDIEITFDILTRFGMQVYRECVGFSQGEHTQTAPKKPPGFSRSKGISRRGAARPE